MRSRVGGAFHRIPARAWAALAFLLAALAVLPGIRPRADLRTICSLQAMGRFGISCDLSRAADGTRLPWLRQSLVVFEDGVPLRDVSRSRQVRKQGLGTYVVESGMLWFSSIDGSNPLHNRRRYEIVPVEIPASRLSPGLRGTAMISGLVAFVLTFRRSRAAGYVAASGISVLCLGIQAWAALNYAPVHVDAGSSLPTARYLAAGAVPYRDILFNYTPLGVMALAGWGMLGPGGGIPAHTFSLALVLLLECGCAFQVFRISRALGVPAALAGTAALSCLSMFMGFDGSRILLEPMYLLVVLTALRALIASPATRGPWVAGGLASIAFLVKQYGGFGLWGALFASLALPRRAASAGKVVLGSAVVLGTVSVLLFAAGIDLRVLALQTAGTDYPRRWETVWIQLYFRTAPFLIMVPALFLRREWRQAPGVRILGAYLAASGMPLLVRQHQYYLQNPSPFLFISFATLVAIIVTREAGERARWIETAAVICLVSLPIRAAQGPAERMPPVRGAQERRALLMTSFWPSGKPALMFAAPSFMALTGYLSPDPVGLGYRFLNESSLEQVRAGMRQASAAWVDPDSMNARGDFDRAHTSLEEELKKNGFEFQMTLEDRFELWTKGGAPPARERPASVDVD
jgi:hypothetical protein